MFRPQIGLNVDMYVNDMLVKSLDEEKHLDDLQETFDTLRRHQMKLNPSNIRLGTSKEHQGSPVFNRMSCSTKQVCL